MPDNPLTRLQFLRACPSCATTKEPALRLCCAKGTLARRLLWVLEHPFPRQVLLTRVFPQSHRGAQEAPVPTHAGASPCQSGSPGRGFVMEQYDDTFEPADEVPTIKEIEKRLRRLGCTNEQVSRHLEQVTKGRTKPAPQRSKNRPHRIDWP